MALRSARKEGHGWDLLLGSRQYEKRKGDFHIVKSLTNTSPCHETSYRHGVAGGDHGNRTKRGKESVIDVDDDVLL